MHRTLGLRRTFGLLSMAALLSAPAVLGLSQTAGASTGTGAHLVAGGPLVHPLIPNSNIKLVGGIYKYVPHTLNVLWSGPTEVMCTQSLADFSVTNITTHSERMTYGGSTFVRVPPGQTEYICAFGSGTETAVFGLGNSTRILTVNVT
jgi:hypothetical protein